MYDNLPPGYTDQELNSIEHDKFEDEDRSAFIDMFGYEDDNEDDFTL